MTLEEKAKAYDLALELAKVAYKDTDRHIKATIERIFPDLKESEDERIGNVLYCIVRDNKEVKRILEGNGISVDATLAYLEKQKEQKHPNGCFTCDEYKKGYEEGRRNGFTAGYNKAMKEVEQKEQKPAWSEEDEKRIKQLIYDTEHICAEYEKRKDELGECFNDELIKDCDKQIAWLKYLLLQPKPEWSEEDESHRNFILESLEDQIRFCKKDAEGAYYTKQIRTAQNWLKRLRHSWKPSEHQMNILKAVKEYVGRGSGYWGEALGSLIEDLEKLMQKV